MTKDGHERTRNDTKSDKGETESTTGNEETWQNHRGQNDCDPDPILAYHLGVALFGRNVSAFGPLTCGKDALASGPL